MDASASSAINTLVSNGTIIKSKIIVKNGIKIGILGRMGTNAVFDAPNAAPLHLIPALLILLLLTRLSRLRSTR